MSNRAYDILKVICTIVLPAACTLIATIGGIWGFDVEKIVLTVAAVNTFIGALIGVSSHQYNKSLEG